MKVITSALYVSVILLFCFSDVYAGKIVGQLEPFARTTLKSQIEGEVQQIFFKTGDALEKGRQVIQIDKTDYTLEYKSALENQNLSRINYDFSKTEYKRYEKLIKTRVVTTQLFDTQKNNYQNFKYKKNLAHIAVAQAKRKIEKTRVKVPYTASISARYVEVGDYVRIGDNLLEIVDLTRIKAVFFILPEDYRSYTLGMEVRLTVPDLNEVGILGTVFSIAPTIIGADPGYRMEVLLDNKNYRLSPDFDVELSTPSKEKKTHE